MVGAPVVLAFWGGWNLGARRCQPRGAAPVAGAIPFASERSLLTAGALILNEIKPKA